LTSLTTSFCVDFLGMCKNQSSSLQLQTRKKVHILISLVLFIIILGIKYLNNDSIISTLFLLASYTYGPLLGLFVFSLFTKRTVVDRYVPLAVFISPVLSYYISIYDVHLLKGFDFGPDLIIVNGAITFFLLLIISKK